ncbi:hypothetical protein JTB14_001856 [Gonioctena quinquepunctata]|nr:hypothetical protein JTB14_001856 [Gonioctena quinquepunctata]
MMPAEYISGKFLIFYSIFGICPFYDFNGRKLTKQIWNKMWSAFLIGHQIANLYVTVSNEFADFGNYQSIAVELLRIATDFSFTLTSIIIPLCLFFTCEEWENFLQRLQRTDDISTISNTKRNSKSNMIIYSVTIIDMIYHVYEFDSTEDDWTMLYFMTLEHLSLLFMQTSLNSIIENIQLKFSTLNELLENKILAVEKNGSIDSNVQNYAIKRIKVIKKLHRDLTNLVNDIDGLYGWPIIVLGFHILSTLLSVLNGFVLQEGVLLDELIDLVKVTGYMVCFLLTCDLTAAEGKMIINISYNLEQKFGIESPIRMELLELAEYVRYRRPTFILLGMFELNRRTLLSMVSCLTTYLIIIIQFNLTL